MFYYIFYYQASNCDIHAQWKILFVNEMKWYKIWQRPNGFIQNIF